MSEIPFMATENIMMDAVKKGGDRQELHEKIRQHSMEAGKRVKVDGLDNNLAELIAADEAFGLTEEEITSHFEPKNFVGRAPEQVVDFMQDCVNPVTEKYKDLLDVEVEINV
jgi:adenylosuccinate lyase